MRGIYVIICWANGAVYVGSSVDIGDRWNEHHRQLRGEYHHCQYLQNAWNKYGEAAFEFGVYKEMPGASPQELIDAETEVWELWEGDRFSDVRPDLPPSCNPEVAAKISKALKGRRLSLEHVAKVKASNLGKTRSSETKARMSAANKRRPPPSPETRAKISAALKGGSPHTDESKAKISFAHTGVPRPQAVKDKISKANKGHVVTAETRAKLSAAQRRYQAERRVSDGC
jgi:hypothetical protein